MRVLVLKCVLLFSYGVSVHGQINLAFGSCSKPSSPQLLWDDIKQIQPDAWIWLGDNVYGDTEDMTVLRSMYQAQNKIPGYTQLKEQTAIYGIWDDHDYGANDGDKTYSKKAESKLEMFDWLEVPEADPSRSREGAHQDYVLSNENLSTHLILLDARYFRDPIDRIDGVYVPNGQADLLGEQQWAWLENLLSTSTADIFVIACGIQFIPFQHRFEKWANHPGDQWRLFDIFSQIKQPIVLLSGDRHRGEIMVKNLNGKKEIVEVTSSSLTHSHPSKGEPNVFRQGALVQANNFGSLLINKVNEAIHIQAQIISNDGVIESTLERSYIKK